MKESLISFICTLSILDCRCLVNKMLFLLKLHMMVSESLQNFSFNLVHQLDQHYISI